MVWKFGYHHGHVDGFEAGMTATEQRYERIVAVLREQLMDQTALAREQCLRADLAVDQLLLKVGLKAVTTTARVEAKERDRLIMERLDDDPFEELPIGDARGTFKTSAEALFGPSLAMDGVEDE